MDTQAYYSNPLGAKVTSIIYDCKNPQELAEFYAKLLGGKSTPDPYGSWMVAVPGLGVDLGFQEDPHYHRPVFLGDAGDQQPMVHLDLQVEDREAAADYALSIGATLPEQQFCQPDWEVQWTTLLDPEGHPFCLFQRDTD